METVLERVKSEYDLVVIDTPPLTAVSDAFPLLSKVDGVVIVGRVGRNRRDVAEGVHETLRGAGAPLLGVIANGFKARRNAPYSYAYDYSYVSEKQSATPAAGVSPNGAVSAEEPVSTTKG
jgi:Mrp family chromosome partitioning ATPase